MSVSDPVAPERLEALLRGEAGADDGERRIGALLDELTVGELAPPAELRERVRLLSAPPPEASAATRRMRHPRRPGWRVASAFGAAATIGVVGVLALTRGTSSPPTAVQGAASAQTRQGAATGQELGPVVDTPAMKAARAARVQDTTPTAAPPASAGSAAVPSPDGQRAQDYSASLRLAVGSVADLSRSTQTVLDTVRSLGGAVESVDYGTPSAGSGSALIALRIPVARSQDALRQFSALGTITSQQVQIRDLQSGLDQETNRVRALRRRIALLQAKLLSPALAPEARATLEGRLADSQAALASVLRGVHATQQRAAFARFSLALVTGSGTAVAPEPAKGAFERTAGDALGVISVAGRGALFALIVGGPFLLVAGGAWWLARRLRRRAARRLLERS